MDNKFLKGIMGDLYKEEEQVPTFAQDIGVMPPSAPAPKPELRQYLAKKYNKPELVLQPAPEMPMAEEPMSQTERSGGGFDWQAGLVGLGSVLQQKSPVESIMALQKNRADEQERQIQQDIRARETDPNSQESDLARQLASTMLPGYDFSKMNAAQINSRFPNLQRIYEAKLRQDEQALRRQEMRALMGERREEREAIRDEKRNEKELALAVPGFERTGEVLPKAEEAQKLRKATANAEQLQTKLNRLKELVKTAGSYEYGGQAGQEMASLATEIQLLSKSPEMYELGVLTGPDMGLLQKITADPESLDSLFTRDSTRLKQIDTQLKSVADKTDSIAKSMGYRRQGAPASEKAAPGSASGLTPEQRRARIEELRRKAGK